MAPLIRREALLRTLVLAAGTVVATDVLFGDPPQTTISVEVKNGFDKPVDNATVILDFLGSHQVVKGGRRKRVHWEVHTDQTGHAHFPPVPQGTIQLQVVAKDYQTFGHRYDVDQEQKSFSVELERPQSQYSAHPPLKPANPKPDDGPK